MSWNHRVVRYPDIDEGDCFIIEEVYYTKRGKPRLHNSGAKAAGASLSELRQSLTWMRAALKKPILDGENFPKVWKPYSKRSRQHKEGK